MGVHSNIAAMGGRSAAMGERKNMRAALLDTKGPEVRTGLLADGAKTITLEEGAAIELTFDPACRDAGTARRLYVDYQQLATTVGRGSMILLDDGLIALEVEATRQAGAVAEELRAQRKRPLSEDEWTTLKLEAGRAAWQAAVAARQPKAVKLCEASAGELRTAAQWMENEPGLSWEEALKIAREVHFGAWHFASTSLIP